VNIPIDKLPLSGTDLAFTTYPSALCMLPFPNFWAIIFFFILITLGIDSQVIFIFRRKINKYYFYISKTFLLNLLNNKNKL